MLKEGDAESIADKVYRELYFMIDDLNVENMMGKWYTVVDSPGLHSERCVVSTCMLAFNTRSVFHSSSSYSSF